ncbi:BamA/TamA family outer membrane protein [Haliangium sp.]|uniref:BamA/TamA family outer membrane protein n=1 Tax=Haliangium sp. TaxID=2663208 RepID=UPI003D0971A7
MRALCVGAGVLVGVMVGVAAPARVEAQGSADQRAQADEQKSRRELGWTVLPGAWFSTDRGLGVSLSGLLYLPLDADETKPSELGLVGIVTTRGDNVLRLAPVLRFERHGYQIDGRFEVARRGGTYYGVGNDTDADAAEDFRRFKLVTSGNVLRRWRRGVHVGLAWDLTWRRALELDDDADELASGRVRGVDAGVLVGLGAVARLDTRDRVYAPTRGTLTEASAFVYSGYLGSDEDFARLSLDARAYVPIATGHVLAVHALASARSGAPPFDLLASAGDTWFLRGIAGGRMRDRHLVGAQIEYRSPMWWRLGLVLFGATGRVGHRLSELADAPWRTAAGVGLRFAAKREDHVHIRFDVGFSADGYQAYINLREAF